MKIRIQIPKTWFNHGYAHLIMYLRDNPGLPVEMEYKAEDGFLLGGWMTEVRYLWDEGYLSGKQIEKLESIGLAKDQKDQSWESMYRLLRDRMQETGEIPGDIMFKTEEGVMLGAWIDRQERLFTSLPVEKQEKLHRLGVGKALYED